MVAADDKWSLLFCCSHGIQFCVLFFAFFADDSLLSLFFRLLHFAECRQLQILLDRDDRDVGCCDAVITFGYFSGGGCRDTDDSKNFMKQ